jgi:hypothetical protein
VRCITAQIESRVFKKVQSCDVACVASFQQRVPRRVPRRIPRRVCTYKLAVSYIVRPEWIPNTALGVTKSAHSPPLQKMALPAGY